jgi:riboflavin synthase alpha subunit
MNLETDIIGRYIERLLFASAKGKYDSVMSFERLRELGY